ncbi:MAG: Rieske 2Fe-2S domain-containing protein [Proteobacteria bacterium]|nr:Rieske 2Fe-2S domain-containing protein [Pseudomonadota bacterium]
MDENRDERASAQTAPNSATTSKPSQAHGRYLDAHFGLRNHWYAAFFSADLDNGDTRAEVLLGERILFKRSGGTIYAIEDRCPHRGVALSTRPECHSENTVTCWLHGFTFDVRDGQLVQILTDPESRLIGNLAVPTYPIVERSGVVFIFIGDREPPPLERDVQPKFVRPNLVVHPMGRTIVRSDWRLAAEISIEGAHIYSHRLVDMVKNFGIPVPFSTLASAEEIARVDSSEGPIGVISQPTRFVWSADLEGARVNAANYDPDNPPPPMDIATGLFLPGVLEVEPFPMPGLVHLEWYVPIDDNHYVYMFATATICDDPAEIEAFHRNCEEQYRQSIMDFVDDDIFIREQLYHAYAHENWWQREQLAELDAEVHHWRDLVEKHARGVQSPGNPTLAQQISRGQKR